MTFRTFAELLIHKSVIHNQNDSKQCPLCGNLIVLFKIIQINLIYSDKRLANNTNVIIHVLHHTDERLHKCHVCEQSFYDASSLQKHKNTHLFKKPYICSDCGKDFAQKVNLKKHQFNRHQYVNVKPYCLFCTKF